MVRAGGRRPATRSDHPGLRRARTGVAFIPAGGIDRRRPAKKLSRQGDRAGCALRYRQRLESRGCCHILHKRRATSRRRHAGSGQRTGFGSPEAVGARMPGVDRRAPRVVRVELLPPCASRAGKPAGKQGRKSEATGWRSQPIPLAGRCRLYLHAECGMRRSAVWIEGRAYCFDGEYQDKVAERGARESVPCVKCGRLQVDGMHKDCARASNFGCRQATV